MSWKVPFDKDGNHIKCVYRWQDPVEDGITYKERYEFHGTMIYHKTVYNNSTTNIIFKDFSTGKLFVSTDTVLYQALTEKRVLGNSIEGDWYFKKSGAMVLLYLHEKEKM